MSNGGTTVAKVIMSFEKCYSMYNILVTKVHDKKPKVSFLFEKTMKGLNECKKSTFPISEAILATSVILV